MKTYCGVAVLAVAIFVAGCGKEQAAAPASEPTGYAGTLVKGQQSSVKVIDVTSLNQDIQLFNVQEGRNPKDLDELVAKHYVGALPEVPQGMKFVYDASQGKVSLASR
jgi:nitrous oxide reductase accessory protein NosL